MAKAELKPRPDKGSVKALMDVVSDPQARTDCLALSRLMRKATGRAPRMWGRSIVGFGSYRGREGEWMLTDFSPRKRSLERLEDIDLPTLAQILGASVRAKS